MSGTYRTTLVYTRDGEYGFGRKARTAAAEMKKIDRRAKRRQAAKIKREAMAEFEEETAIAREEAIRAHIEAEWYDDEPMIRFDSLQEWYEEEERAFIDNRNECWEYDDYDYSSDYLAYEYQPRLKSQFEMEAERAGKSLGEILSEAIAGREVE